MEAFIIILSLRKWASLGEGLLWHSPVKTDVGFFQEYNQLVLSHQLLYMYFLSSEELR